MSVGLTCCGLAWLWMGVLGSDYPAGRFTLLTIGLLTAAISIIIRLKFTQPVFLTHISQRQRNLILTALVVLLGGLALVVSVLLLLAFMKSGSVPWRWGPMLIVWIALVPMAEFAAVQSFRRLRQGDPLTQREEGAALLLLAAVACFAATRALLDPQDVFAMETMRLFLSVLTLVALAAAPLVLVPQDLRRKVVSFLVLLHFTGAIVITLVVVHPPWALRQLADRIFRPYLQFIYVTNAYHFYAPEPGPNNYMWYRINFIDKDGNETGQWLKVPELDEETAQHSYPTSLTYVRHMCLMDHAGPSVSAPAFFDANFTPLDFYRNRLLRTPGIVYMSQAKTFGPSPKNAADSVENNTPPDGKPASDSLKAKTAPAGDDRNAASKSAQGELGEAVPTNTKLMIPFHPQFTHELQYRRPAAQAEALLRSYSRHVLSKAELTSSGKLVFKSWFGRSEQASDRWKVKSVKIYYVTHAILSPEVYRLGVDEPWDPHTYRGYFVGEFDGDGNMIDTQDPFLYWMLPVIRETQERDSIYHDYIRRHAGDANWVRNDKKQWGPDSNEKP
jgi:hypothetical protein